MKKNIIYISATVTSIAFVVVMWNGPWGRGRKSNAVINEPAVAIRQTIEENGSGNQIPHSTAQGWNELLVMLDMEKDSEKRRELCSEIACLMANEDPREGIRWALSLSSSTERMVALSRTVAAIARDNPALASELVKELPNGVVKDHASVALISSIPLEMLGRFMSEDLGLTINGAANVAEGVVFRLTQANMLDKVRAIGEEITPGVLLEQYNLAAIRSLSTDSPEMALEWLIENKSWVDGDEAVDLVTEGFASIDPEAGIVAAGRLEDPSLRNQFLKDLGLQWAWGDTLGAGRWLEQAGAGDEYGTFRGLGRGVLEAFVAVDQQRAFEIINGFRDESSRITASADAIELLTKFDPESAAMRLGLNNGFEEQMSVELATTVAASWLPVDSLGASEWIADMPAGAIRDSAILRVVDFILAKDGDVAAAKVWASELQSRKLQRDVEKRVGSWDGD